MIDESVQRWLDKIGMSDNYFYHGRLDDGDSLPVWATIERRLVNHAPLPIQYLSEYLDYQPWYCAYRCMDIITCKTVLVYYWNSEYISFAFLDGKDLLNYLIKGECKDEKSK